MTITEHDLRELLERDSADGPYRGVTVADVDGRARAIRRRRTRVLGAVAAAGLAITVAANLPGTETGTPPDDVWTGVLTQPTPSPNKPWFYAEELVNETYQQAGKRETVTFAGTDRRIGITMDCPRGSYALAWLNGTLEVNAPCGRGSEAQSTLTTMSFASLGRNTLSAVVLPGASVPSGQLSAMEADEAAAWAVPYKAKWSVLVLVDKGVSCTTPIVIVDPGTGREVLSSSCPSVKVDVAPRD